MSYSEQIVIDTINAKDTGHIEIRVSNRVLKDGVVISTTYHRHVLTVGDDLTLQDPKIQAVCAACWTPELMLAKTADIVAQSKVTAAAQAKADADKAACEIICKEAEAAKVKADLATEAAKTALEAQLAAEKALATFKSTDITYPPDHAAAVELAANGLSKVV